MSCEIDVTGESEVEISHPSVDALLDTSNVDIIAQDNTELELVVTKKEFVITGDNIYIPVSQEEAPQWLVDFIDTQIALSYDQNLNDLEQATVSLNTLIEELDVAKDTYTQSIISENDIDQKINASITTLNSELRDADATIVDLVSTKVTEDEASAISTEVLDASIADGAIGSLVGQINSAIADGDSANANSISVLEAQINDEETGINANAGAIDSINVYVGLDEAGASNNTGLSAYLEDSEGNIGGADSKVANAVYVDGNGDSTSKFEYSSLLHKNGVYYNAGFGLNVFPTGGNGSELDPYDSEFLINAETFKFTNSAYSGTAAPFTIDASGSQPQITFNGLVTFGSGQSGTIDEAIAAGVDQVTVGDKNINITDNLIPTTSLVSDVNNSGYQFIGTPTKSNNAGIDVFAEPQIVLDGSDEVYSPYVDEMTIPYYYRFGIKGITNLDRFRVVTIDGSTPTNRYVTYVMEEGQSLSTTEWYVVDGIINPPGGSANPNGGTIRDVNGNKVGTITTVVIPSGTDSLVLGWVANCTISRMKLSKITADTQIGDYVDYDYVDSSLENSGYVLPAEVANAVNNNTTTIEGSKITTGTIGASQIVVGGITADRINTTGLVAENIKATSTIEGNRILGSIIEGAVIKASYLDLDGELEVLTDYHIPVTTYNSNPSLYTDAIYIEADNEYRIPTLSSLKESSTTLSGTDLGTYTIYGSIHSYNTANVGNNRKVASARPMFSNTSGTLLSTGQMWHVTDTTRLMTIKFRIGSTLIATVDCYGWYDGSRVDIVTNYGTVNGNSLTIPVFGQISIGIGVVTHLPTNDTDPYSGRHQIVATIDAGDAPALEFDWTSGLYSVEFTGYITHPPFSASTVMSLGGLGINNLQQ